MAWHLCEEIEHRTVTFDAYDQIVGKYLYRLADGHHPRHPAGDVARYNPRNVALFDNVRMVATYSAPTPRRVTRRLAPVERR